MQQVDVGLKKKADGYGEEVKFRYRLKMEKLTRNGFKKQQLQLRKEAQKENVHPLLKKVVQVVQKL